MAQKFILQFATARSAVNILLGQLLAFVTAIEQTCANNGLLSVIHRRRSYTNSAQKLCISLADFSYPIIDFYR
jgi:hypothetical protein